MIGDTIGRSSGICRKSAGNTRGVVCVPVGAPITGPSMSPTAVSRVFFTPIISRISGGLEN